MGTIQGNVYLLRLGDGRSAILIFTFGPRLDPFEVIPDLLWQTEGPGIFAFEDA